MKVIAQKKGGECLSNEYINSRSKLKWQCVNGHIWVTKPRMIIQGHRCPVCSKNQYSINDMKKIASMNNGECLSDHYSNIFGILEWKCSMGHTWNSSAKSVVVGHWCSKCALEARKLKNNEILSPEKLTEINKIAHQNSGKCLSKKYINCTTKLKWQCYKGHIWEATPSSIKRGSWCPCCANEMKTIKNNPILINNKLSEIKNLSKEKGIEFISNDFKDVSKKYIWKCNRCGYEFDRTIEKMKISNGCPKCTKERANEKIRIHSLEEMKKLAKLKNGECLSNKYVNCDTKIKWKCNICGNTWESAATTILRGQWCSKCALEKKKIINNSILQENGIKLMQELAQKKGGKCLSSTYYGSYYKLRWQCDKGHTWSINPSSIKSGSWCPVCNGTPTYTIEDMKILAELKKGTCLSAKYIDSHTNLKWKCSYGHTWESTPRQIIQDRWCPYCSRVISLNEYKCKYIFENLTKEKFPKTRKVLDNGLELDGYCNKLKLAFEYQGEQHYEIIKLFHMDDKKLNKIKQHDRAKVDMCLEKQIKLIIIPFTKSKSDINLLNFIIEELKKCGYNDSYLNEFSFTNFYGNLPHLLELNEIAISKGGKLLSNEYLGRDYKLSFMCSKGHQWSTSPSNIKSGTWCPKCGMESFTNSRKKTIDDMKNLANSIGGECLSNEYNGDKENLLWQCVKGHKWWAIPGSVVGGHWCPTCSKNKKLTIQLMNELAKIKKGKCLSTEYINARTKLKWECEKGHTWEAVPYSIRNGTWCPKCKCKKKERH